MPSIPLEVLECVIYLYASQEAAEEGEVAGGSGFLLLIPVSGYEEEAATFYAVTNAHVVNHGYIWVRLNIPGEGHVTVSVPASDWICHPDGDDLAIAEIDLPDPRVKAITPDSFIDGHDPTMFGIGQEVYMVGRFVSHQGREKNRPTARFGNIAQLPYELVKSESGLGQHAFLVDMRSLSGYSGAPTWVYRTRTDPDDDQTSWVSGFEQRFLGVDSGHLPSFGRVLKADRSGVADPELWAEQNSGMATVIPAWRLSKLLEDEDFVARREKSEQAWIETRDK